MVYPDLVLLTDGTKYAQNRYTAVRQLQRTVLHSWFGAKKAKILKMWNKTQEVPSQDWTGKRNCKKPSILAETQITSFTSTGWTNTEKFL